MDRDIVYNAIDTERDFQDDFLNDKGMNANKTVGEFLTLLRAYSHRADMAWMGVNGHKNALEEIRKIAAICVACMEKHGVNSRNPYTSNTLKTSNSYVPAVSSGRAKVSPVVFVPWQNVVSSNIQAVRYDRANELLQLRFRDGGVYEFSEIDSNTYLRFITAPSKGKFFNTHIKGIYPSAKVN